MRPIPLKLKKEINEDPLYKICARKGLHDHVCEGRITMEHALVYAGRQVNAKFAIIPLCAKAHSVDQFQDGGDLDKEINTWISLNLASTEELLSISKAISYPTLRTRLNAKYGQYERPQIPASAGGINY